MDEPVRAVPGAARLSAAAGDDLVSPARLGGGHLPDRFPIFIRDDEDVHVFGIPTLDGGAVKVAPHASYGQMHDADHLDRTDAAADLEPINVAVANLFPGLVPTPVRVATYMDADTSDGHALVSQMPGTSNVWVLGAADVVPQT